jgi:hypothetical protein
VATVTNINDVLDGHVGLEIECVDRLYLNAYVPNLQVGGQVASFFTRHRGDPIPSPALMEKNGNRFRREVKAFAEANSVPILALKKPDRSRWDDRKLDHVRRHLENAERSGRFGVVAIVATQEFQWVFTAKNRSPKSGVVSYDFVKEERRVGTYYFYVLDADFGPGFIKLCTYFPYPAKVWANGHEWAKRQADRAGVAYTALANGFATCDDPAALQEICDRFGPADVAEFFDRWMAVIPTPLTQADRAGGYWWELSMRQVEVSRTLVFDDPRRARGFFEALVTDNIGIGRPEEVHAVFGRNRRGRTTPQPFGTRVFSPGTDVKMDFRYKHSRVKQYLKEGRLFERIHQPYIREGQRTGALRFGDPRAMALTGALCVFVHAFAGFTNKSLRGLVAGLLGRDYTTNQMTYDLRRLRLHGLIERVPKTNTYVLTPDGLRVALFYTKLHGRLLRPLVAAADRPPAPVELRRALATIDRVITDYVDNARLGSAA